MHSAISTRPQDIYKRVLGLLHGRVIPRLAEPLLLADFLTHALDAGGLTGMLALNGLFLLVTRHGLEYPQFYERLYSLLKPNAFGAKHRQQFFQMMDIFLASGASYQRACASRTSLQRCWHLAASSDVPSLCYAMSAKHSLAGPPQSVSYIAFYPPQAWCPPTPSPRS